MSLLVDILMNVVNLLRNAFSRVLRRRPPDFVWLHITGSLPELDDACPNLLRRRLDPWSSPPSLEGIRSRLDRILADGRPHGVLLRIENLDAGWASLEELRQELHRFRSNGKKVVAYLVDPDTRSYYLAAAGDEVFATPLATLNTVGLRARVNFLKDTLDLAGLRTEVVAVSPYKSAYGTFSRSDFSPEAREQTERLLDQRYKEIVAVISDERGLPPEEVRNLIDLAPYPAREAVRNGLLDGVFYEDELSRRLGEGSPARLAEWGVARRSLRLPYRRHRARKVVGLVSIRGTIVRGSSRRLPIPLPLLGREQAGSDSVVAALRVAEKSRRVGAVLLHVDSPGGDALASDLIWREVQRIDAKKPVVILMGNTAASGGYYVSAAASRVFARKNTITGSIGVILTRPVAAELLNKLKVNPVTIARGARSNLLDPRRAPTPDELYILNQQLQTFYREFKDRVEQGRNLDPRVLEEVAGGRVWTGTEALELSLVDEIGSFTDALDEARRLAGIPEGTTGAFVRVTPPRGPRPMPGGYAREAVEGVSDALSELGEARVWALAPYEISDGW
ncbi:MAG TPA: signal peptide peptidase SppA [Rubrobacteraceae bacterium]|nr:signal peptide peptidase SppA [Rubrobacteraceae bacterium]